MKNKLGIVIEYLENVENGDELVYAEENRPFIDWLVKNGVEAYAIDPLRKPIEGNLINARRISDGGLEKIPLEEFKTIYSGRTGQKFIGNKFSNALGENLKHFCRLVELLKPYEGKIKFVNPLDSIIWNFSKQYLIDFKDSGLPLIPTIEVNSLDELFKLKASRDDWLIKPKIAERATGTRMLKRMSDEEIVGYSKRYMFSQQGDSLPDRILQRQGVIAQVFEERFAGDGEKKFFVVGGEFTLSRNTVFTAMKDERYPIVSTARGARMVRYKPSDVQKEICLNVYHQLHEKGYPIDFMRVDIVGVGRDSKISEIEVINPATGSRIQELYKQEELEDHHKKIIDLCLG